MIFPTSKSRAATVKERNASNNRTLIHIAAYLALLVIGLGSSACGGGARVVPPVPPATQPAPTKPSVPEPDQPVFIEPAEPEPTTTPAGPPIRIGLTTDSSEVRIACRGKTLLVQKIPEAERLVFEGEVQVRVESPGAEAKIFRVQIASLSNADAAERLARDIEKKFAIPAVIRRPQGKMLNQVRVGEFPTREEALKFAQGPLAKAGYQDAFVVQDSTAGTGERVLALRGPDSLFLLSPTGFILSPASEQDHLNFGGRPYRGLLDLSLNQAGRITVVNQLGVEDYLRGVVPAELSPSQYPEDEALAAQAIAARTYALKHLGRYRSEGFDLTDDTRTQVYLGVRAEKDATDRVIKSTYGQAVYYQGDLIDAMYMSTCGGRTEDFAAVFDAPEVPYLQSVVCAVESTVIQAEPNLIGKHRLQNVLFSDGGLVANRELELAAVLGLTTNNPMTQDQMEGVPTDGEIQSWLERAESIAQITVPNDSSHQGDDHASRAGFIQHAAERLFGTAEVDRRISEADAAYYMSNLEDGDEVPQSARRAVAYVMQRGLWHPYPNNIMMPNDPILRKDALFLIVRSIQIIRSEILRTAILLNTNNAVESHSKNEVTLKWNGGENTFPLAGDVSLFQVRHGQSIPAKRLRAIGNERVSFHVDDEGVIDFLEVELNTTGAASDRFSPVASWETSITLDTVSNKLSTLSKGVGKIQDLKPAKIGKSGRAVQIEVIGTEGTKILNGYRVRGALGLRDTLFTIERSYHPDGSIEGFTFHGRGWGHGVGLCQVGAYGMARAGHSYEEILKTYYTGVEIKKAY